MTLLPQLDAGGLLSGDGDAWGDWGLLGVRDPSRAEATVSGSLDFRSFIAAAYPGYAFHTWAERLIALLQRVADGQLNRLIVCCPPRLGKSLLVSKLFPAYWVSRYPHRFCAIASYSAELAYAHSREARHFYRSCGHPLSKDSTAVGNWLTPQRGGCIAAGVRGPFTGKGYALGVIDDPYKGPEDAGSGAQRQKLIEWFQSVWLTRAEPGVNGSCGAAQVVVLTRWHHDDLIGWLLEQEAGEAPQHWHVLDLPAIAEPQSARLPFPSTCSVEPDWRTPGDALCPERFPLSELQQIRIRAGRYWWEALYQQRPSPAEGLLFRSEWLERSSVRTAGTSSRTYAPLVLSCDLSFKGGAEHDPCAFVLLGAVDQSNPPHPLQQARSQGLNLHPSSAALSAAAPGMEAGSPAPLIEVLWAERHQLDLPATVHYLLQTLDALRRQGLPPDAVLIEDAANGPAVCQLLRSRVPGLIAVRPQGSKVSRAHAVAPLLEAGQLGFHRATEALQSELLSFPSDGADGAAMTPRCRCSSPTDQSPRISMSPHRPRPVGHRTSAGPGVCSLRSRQPRAAGCSLAAADALVLEHLEFAYRVAGHYAARTPIPRDDLQQEAAIGLLKAARRYDPGHGSPRPGHFRAYARPFINGEICHYLRDKGFVLGIPGRWRELHARGRKLLASGLAPDEVPARLGISVERWGEIVRACAVRVVALPLDESEPEPEGVQSESI